MITYQTACDTVGYDRRKSAPAKNVKHLAYKNGEVREFKSAIEARRFSSLVETCVINKKEIDEFLNRQRELESAAIAVWLKSLHDEYSDLTDGQFNVIYCRAYDDGHSAGFDEIHNHFSDLYDLCKTFMKEVQ